MACLITELGAMCPDCGRLVQAHSICPQAALAAARASATGLLGALTSGRWPNGDAVGAVESVTLKRFEGEYVEGMAPVEVVRVTVVNGQLQAEKE